MRVPRPHRVVQEEETPANLELEINDEEKRGDSKKESAREDFSEAVVIESGDDNSESVENDDSGSPPTEKRKGKNRANETRVETVATPLSVGDEETEYVDYSNGWPMTILAYLIWLVILVANGYLIVTLAID